MKISSISELEKLSVEDQVKFMELYPDKYASFFEICDDPEDNTFDPDSVKTIDDLEALPLSDQLIFQSEFEEKYLAIISNF